MIIPKWRKFVGGSERDAAYIRAVDAIAALPNTDAQRRAYAEASWRRLCDDWARMNGLKLSQGHACINRLMGKRCTGWPDRDCRPPMADHCSLWNKNGKPEVYVTQPYPQATSELEQLFGFCKERNLHVTVGTWPSWHFPGAVLTVEIRRNDGREQRAPWGP